METETAWKDMPSLVVGRNSKQNDRVSFEIAKPHHLWFHVQGCPGSHCVLLLEQGQSPTTQSLQYAADVAAYFSQARGSTQVAVGYCSPKSIRRAPGGKLGLVQMEKYEGTVFGRPDRGEQYFMQWSSKD